MNGNISIASRQIEILFFLPENLFVEQPLVGQVGRDDDGEEEEGDEEDEEDDDEQEDLEDDRHVDGGSQRGRASEDWSGYYSDLD